MLQKKEPITISEFNKGLFTKGNILINEKGHSPNCMDIKWNFDGSIQKRYGSYLRSTLNIGSSVVATTDGTWSYDSSGTLSQGLIGYWKMDEVNGTRYDQVSDNNLVISDSDVDAESGIINYGASFSLKSNSQNLYCLDPSANKFISNNSSDFNVSSWVKFNTLGGVDVIVAKRDENIQSWQLIRNGSNILFYCSASDNHNVSVTASSFGAINTATFYNIQAWHSNNKHIGVSINKASNTASYAGGVKTLSSPFIVGNLTSANTYDRTIYQLYGCVDEIGYWSRTLNTSEKISLYNNGTGTTYTRKSQGWLLDSQSSLSTNLVSYWKLNETSGVRQDELGLSNLSDSNNVGSASGVRSYAAKFAYSNSQCLYSSSDYLKTNNRNYSISCWVKFDSSSLTQQVFNKGYHPVEGYSQEFSLYRINTSGDQLLFAVSTDGLSTGQKVVVSTSFGALNTSTYYHVVCWIANTSHIGIAVNNVVNTMPLTQVVNVNTGLFTVGAYRIQGRDTNLDGSVDEIGIWNKVLTAQERADLYGGGTGNTYSGPTSTINQYSWGMYDFGASNLRWLTLAAGTGIYASSNMGLSFLTIGTGRSSYYQGFERSKNVLVCTSDRYDPTLYWAGSVGTYCATLAPGSAPNARFSINYKGFLILLNTTAGKRRFHYQDESTQLTSSWPNYFDLPSSADDEITAAFVVNRILFVSTRYKIFKLSYVGGNPDWSYDTVADWGFVPRTVRSCFVKGISYAVVIGLDWSKRIRAFDGHNGTIISDNVESDNGVCDFATSKISYFGSGVAISNAEFDPLEQEYRLNVAVGPTSTQTTHAILFNTRTLAMYPYSKQFYQCMCVAESDNRQFLMAADRSGNVYMMNTGYTDDSRIIDEVYDSPFFFSKVAGMANKGGKLDLFFKPTATGQVYFQDRADFKNFYSKEATKTIDVNTGNYNHLVHSIDVPSTHNIYQYRLMSSGSTTEPWVLTHSDLYSQNLGIGKGNDL